MRLLLVEDDKALVRSLTRDLKRRGVTVTSTHEGLSALSRLEEHSFDICLLDLQISGLHGLRVLERARAGGIMTPIIIITGLDLVAERVRALNLGADDYVVKPFALDELAARIYAVLRRGTVQRDGTLKAGPIILEPQSRRVTVRGRLVQLPNKEYSILELLLRHRNQVLSRDTLIERIWGESVHVVGNVLDVHMAKLRRLIDVSGEESLIRTVRGVGYKLEE